MFSQPVYMYTVILDICTLKQYLNLALSGVSAWQWPLFRYSECLGCRCVWLDVHVHRLTEHVYSFSGIYTLKCLGCLRGWMFVQFLTGGVCVSVILGI